MESKKPNPTSSTYADIGSGSEVVGDGVNVDFRGGGMVVISASNADFS